MPIQLQIRTWLAIIIQHLGSWWKQDVLCYDLTDVIFYSDSDIPEYFHKFSILKLCFFFVFVFWLTQDSGLEISLSNHPVRLYMLM